MAVDANGNQIAGTPVVGNQIQLGNPVFPNGNGSCGDGSTVLPFNSGQAVNLVNPRPAFNISPDDVNAYGADFYQNTITNAGDTTKNVVFSALNGLAGSYSEFAQAPSAADSPAVSDNFGANVQNVQGFNRLIAVEPLIACNIIVTAPDQTQANQRFSVSSVDTNLEFSTKSRMTGTCDPCFSNNNPNVFQRQIRGPLYFGGNQSISYPVLAGRTVTLQIQFSGKGNAPAMSSAGNI